MSFTNTIPNSNSGCNEGKYDSQDQCTALCEKGSCSTNKDSSFQCSGCPKPATSCDIGLYNDWDDCYGHCLNGYCIENAGENGKIRCRCS